MNKWGEIMKSHDEIRELLIPFVLGQLSEKEASDITRHLVECQECGGEVKRLGTILECARQTQNLTADEQLSKSAKETILAAAQETEKTRPRPTISMQNVWTNSTLRIVTNSKWSFTNSLCFRRYDRSIQLNSLAAHLRVRDGF
jgi:anti-sigma factor ChrR (cupin superfamily)